MGDELVLAALFFLIMACAVIIKTNSRVYIKYALWVIAACVAIMIGVWIDEYVTVAVLIVSFFTALFVLTGVKLYKIYKP